MQHDLEGHGGSHAEAHNFYGMQMVRATREAWQPWQPGTRPYVITRSGWASAQRYAAHWTGGNWSSWEHLRLTLPMILGLGLSGLALTGCDTGSFGGAPGGERLVRWYQLSALTPYLRHHSALGTPPQEPWAFGEPYESHIRAAVELRYRLLPYLYTALRQRTERGLPLARPLCLAFQDDPATHAVAAPPGTLPLFARGGSVVPAWPLVQYIAERALEALTLHVVPGCGTSWLYEDDGESTACERGERRVMHFVVRQTDGRLEIARTWEGAYRPGYGRQQVVVHGVERAPIEVLADGQAVERGISPSDTQRTAGTSIRSGMRPSCWSRPSRSWVAQRSTILPLAMRKKAMACHDTRLLVGGTPMKLPLWMPLKVPRTATVSPSEITLSMARWKSANASWYLETLCFWPASPCACSGENGLWSTKAGERNWSTALILPLLNASSR